MFKLDLEKAEETEIKLPTSAGSSKKQQNSRKISTSASLIILKSLTVWITTNCGKFLKRWEYQTILPASWETCMQVKKQQLESDMKLWTGSKLGKKYIKAVYCHPDYLTYMQSTPYDSILISRDYFANKGPYSQSYGFSSSHVWMWELDHKEGWTQDKWWFWTVRWRRLLRVPWTAKRSSQLI